MTNIQAENARKKAQGEMEGYLTNPGGGFTLYGDINSNSQVASELSQVGAMTGQNIFDAGQQQQDYYKSLQARRGGNDAVGADMKNRANQNQAVVARQLAGKNISGGAGADAMLQAKRAGDAANATQGQQFGRQNDQELWNYVKRNQKVTGEALSAGQDKALASTMDTSAASGTLACFVLVSMGLMSKDLYAKEANILGNIDPVVVRTYRDLSPRLVSTMKSNPSVVKIVAPLAVAWAEERTHERPNLTGKILRYLGEPMLKVVGILSAKKGTNV